MLLLHLLFLYLFIYLLVDLQFLWPQGSCIALEAEHHPFQLHICGTSESFALPGPYDGAKLYNLIIMASSCGEDTCFITSDKTLHFPVSAFLLESVTQIVQNKCSQDLLPYALLQQK